MKLYGLRWGTWTDPWGGYHQIRVLYATIEVIQAGTFPYHNGYETCAARVYVPTADHKFAKHTFIEVPPTDFSGTTMYVRRPRPIAGHPDGRTFWVARLPIRVMHRNRTPCKPHCHHRHP